ncbi:hypothetical protein SJI00_09565 [Pseudomonas sp. RP23018S]|uniref:hypothetical protein n=1 Tax=Pseudomonas sp. RP23018S TaxID=3096037 RepID=UPI002ACA6ECC|nr:hypothetical protein [Pseudomonas sp. RP23018S]MDZ5603019.1 hypothetical protein [Pseudomonas sp. RP23018S]
MKKIVPDPPPSPVTFPPHLSAREALACADTLLKDIYEAAEAYRRQRPGKSAKAIDSVMDSTLIAAALLMHASQTL